MKISKQKQVNMGETKCSTVHGAVYVDQVYPCLLTTSGLDAFGHVLLPRSPTASRESLQKQFPLREEM